LTELKYLSKNHAGSHIKEAPKDTTPAKQEAKHAKQELSAAKVQSKSARHRKISSDSED
jgi:hypothetical protein